MHFSLRHFGADYRVYQPRPRNSHYHSTYTRFMLHTKKCDINCRIDNPLENDIVEFIMILYHASKQIVQFPEVRKGRFTKDFSWGFYCTNKLDQAIRWANRGPGEPIINIYEYIPNNSLNILKFDELNDAWLDFIAACRNGKTHHYDVVEGPMADDTIWNYVNDFLSENLSREQFWVLARFKKSTHQISFHTLSALDCLTYQNSEVIYDEQ